MRKALESGKRWEDWEPDLVSIMSSVRTPCWFTDVNAALIGWFGSSTFTAIWVG